MIKYFSKKAINPANLEKHFTVVQAMIFHAYIMEQNKNKCHKTLLVLLLVTTELVYCILYLFKCFFLVLNLSADMLNVKYLC